MATSDSSRSSDSTFETNTIAGRELDTSKTNLKRLHSSLAVSKVRIFRDLGASFYSLVYLIVIATAYALLQLANPSARLLPAPAEHRAAYPMRPVAATSPPVPTS